jgi:hypothetical protein
MLTDNTSALNYTLRHLLIRAGAESDWWLSRFTYGERVVLTDEMHVFVKATRTSAWEALLRRPTNTLPQLQTKEVVPDGTDLPFNELVPVLFWGKGYEDGRKPFAEIRDEKTVVFYADIVAATFFMLSRWEEMIGVAQDIHGRFPGTASVAFRQNFLERPIVDEYALILQKWLQTLCPGWEPRSHRFSIKLSHDIDTVYPFSNLNEFIRSVGGDFLKRRGIQHVWRTAKDGLWQLFGPKRTSCYRNISLLASLSVRHGLKSAFYFMTAKPSQFDRGYDITSLVVKDCVDDLRRRGFEIGFHAGYHALNDPACLAAEKARLDNVLGITKYGGRQHYLRFKVPVTWWYWEQVGLTYDSTMTYAEHEGFRCGTCHPFRPFDLQQNRELNLVELPLIVMDRTLQTYRELSPLQGEAKIMSLAQRCRRVGGIFTLLWHNTRSNYRTQGWWEMYPRLIRKLGQMQAEARNDNK